MARPQGIELYEMAIWEMRVAMLGIDIVYSDRIVSAADVGRDMLSQFITSTVEYKGAGDFLVQHAERVITAQQRLAREGWWTGGKPLYGFARYEFPPNGGPPLKLERGMGTRSAGYHVKVRPDCDDPVRYVALKAMIAWWRQGLGFGAIATRLNKLGVPSPDAGHSRTEKGVTHALSGQWQVNTVKNILLNPPDRRYAGVWPAIGGEAAPCEPKRPAAVESRRTERQGRWQEAAGEVTDQRRRGPRPARRRFRTAHSL